MIQMKGKLRLPGLRVTSFITNPITQDEQKDLLGGFGTVICGTVETCGNGPVSLNC